MTAAESLKFKGVRSHPQEQPIGGLGFDRVTIALCGWFIGRLYLDGWTHNHIAEYLDPFLCLLSRKHESLLLESEYEGVSRNVEKKLR